MFVENHFWSKHYGHNKDTIDYQSWMGSIGTKCEIDSYYANERK